MPYDPLTDEQREIRDLVRTLARERVAPRAAEIDKQGEFPWDMVELFREHELFGLPFYIAAKVPVYLRLLGKRQVEWVRTKRDGAGR